VFFLILTVQKEDALVLLRAVGASSRDVITSVLIQVLVVVGLGALIGSAVTAGLLALTRDVFGAGLQPLDHGLDRGPDRGDRPRCVGRGGATGAGHRPGAPRRKAVASAMRMLGVNVPQDAAGVILAVGIFFKELVRRPGRFVPVGGALTMLVVLLVVLGGFLDGLGAQPDRSLSRPRGSVARLLRSERPAHRSFAGGREAGRRVGEGRWAWPRWAC
jgi:ABC-type antimicrobial peptide transport system permease subunit